MTTSKRNVSEPQQRRRRRWLPRLLLGAFFLLVLGVCGFAVALAFTPVPKPNELATSQATIVYWSDGTTELGRLGDSTRRSIPLSEIPLDVQHAVLAAEDRDFYDHGGFSPIGIGRALVNNVTGGSLQGGSTITQQYAKNAYLSQERSLWRKAQEAFLAIKLETAVSKDQILEDYLNTIYFGRGAYGIEAASLAYFGIPASQLTVEQGAVLASVIKSPGGLAPETNIEGLRARWAYVLDAMTQKGWLSPRDQATAVFPEILKQKPTNRLGGQVGFMLEAVKAQMRELGWSDADIEGGGLRIVSTFDRQAQEAATQAVKDAGPTTGTKGLRIGLAAVRPETGEVIAMYGGKDYIDDQINNATRRFAQAGSTFKPYALTAAIEQGITLDSVWDGTSPQTIKDYTLTNFGDQSYGDISLLTATERSVNTAYVNLEDTVGVQATAEAAYRLGLPRDTPGVEPLNLTFVLGTASPSALDVAGSYATFAARGAQVSPTVVSRVLGPNGGLLYELQPEVTQAFDSRVMDTVNVALQGVVTNGSGFAAQQLGRPAAGKTGTTDDNKSAWFVGYTPQLAAAVLMAKEDSQGRPISMSGTGGLDTVTGGSFPASIWTAFMTAALADEPVLDFIDSTPTPQSSSASPTSSSASPSPSGSTSSATPTTSPTPTPTPTPTPSPTRTPTPTPTPTPTRTTSSSAQAAQTPKTTMSSSSSPSP